jgi:hypothetical protein
MAVAFVRVTSVQPDPELGPMLTVEVGYSGPEVASFADLQPVLVEVETTDDNDTIRDKIVAAILADAETRNYPITAADLTLPMFQKGQ